MKRILCLPLAFSFFIAGCQNPSDNQHEKLSSSDSFRIGIPPENDTMKHEQTEFYTPVPPVVAPGNVNTAPPGDAIILFNGKDMDGWVSANDTTKQAEWTVSDNTFTVKPGAGNIQTRQKFEDYQLHIEWRSPVEDKSKHAGQDYGNSGLFLASLGTGDAGYELQILDSYENTTYSNGQCGSLYKQYPPLVNACKPPGEWQSYDVIWHAPKFNADSSLMSPATVTAFQNGILIQDHAVLKGVTLYVGHPYYLPHGPSPIKLQDHQHEVSFRNVWVRPLK